MAETITYWSFRSVSGLPWFPHDLPGRAVEESLELQGVTPLSKAVEELEESGYQVRNDPLCEKLKGKQHKHR